MPLSFLLATVNLDDIAEALERMKRQPNGQDDVQSFYRVVPADQPRKRFEIVVKKVKVFKHKQDQTCAHDAQDEKSFSGHPCQALDVNAGNVVDQNRNK
jgi:hypothetical protein